MDSLPIEKYNTILTTLSRAEFFTEQIFSNYSPGPNTTIQVLSIYEIAKLFFRLKKYAQSNDRIYITEDLLGTQNPDQPDKKEEKITKQFFKENQTTPPQ